MGWSLWKNTDIVVISIFCGNKSRSNYIIIVEILMLPTGRVMAPGCIENIEKTCSDANLDYQFIRLLALCRVSIFSSCGYQVHQCHNGNTVGIMLYCI